MSNGTKVQAPNGQRYTFHGSPHAGRGDHGYVYALGHRVYGRLGELTFDDVTRTWARLFTPNRNGKWSFTVATIESAVTESASA